MNRNPVRRLVNGKRTIIDTCYPISSSGKSQAEDRAALLRSMDDVAYVRKEGSRYKVLVAREWQ